MYAAAFLGEIWRGAIEAIPRQQWEAAAALAADAGRATALRDPAAGVSHRACRRRSASWCSSIKGTSIASIIGFVELTRAGQLMVNVTFQPMIVYPARRRALFRAVLADVAAGRCALERRIDAALGITRSVCVSASARTRCSTTCRSTSSAGEVVAVIGRSGSGKTTLAALHQRSRDDRRRARSSFDGKPLPTRRADAARTAARHRHRLPELQPVSASFGRAQHHARRRRSPTSMPLAEAKAIALDVLREVDLEDKLARLSRRSSPAASSSASRSRARWRCSRG